MLNVQFTLMVVLAVLAVGFQLAALVDAVRVRADAYPATGNQTKAFWVVLLAIAFIIGLVSVPPRGDPLNFFNLIAVVAAGVYFARVRPEVKDLGPNRGGGPYGGW